MITVFCTDFETSWEFVGKVKDLQPEMISMKREKYAEAVIVALNNPECELCILK